MNKIRRRTTITKQLQGILIAMTGKDISNALIFSFKYK